MNMLKKIINSLKKVKKDENKVFLEKELEVEEKLSIFQNKAKGAIYGLAIGDALGAPLEFQNLLEEDEITHYVIGGVHRSKSGEFTDDTSMALALMDSLNTVGFNLKDQADRYVSWQKRGKYSARGHCFDIGITTVRSLSKYEITQDPLSGLSEYYHSGNGSLMRLAPVPLYFYSEGLKSMVERSVESSRTTHQSDIVLDSIKYFVVIFEKILNGERDKDKLIKLTDEEMDIFNIKNETLIELLHDLDFNNLEYNKIKTDGFVIYSTIVALYCFQNTNSFKEAVLMAVNMGGDADTNGAITGQLAGAYYGYDSIPKNLVNGLNPKELVDEYAVPFIKNLKERE